MEIRTEDFCTTIPVKTYNKRSEEMKDGKGFGE